ncbi:MAG: hypothetical protein PWP64_1305 [Candidatus Cloacimonadota bacterium]|nr:hypothetical protein [Candidatus Cloacimonadota bacterium]
MKKRVEPDPTLCFDGFTKKIKDKEKIMTQPKRKIDERAELVKLFRKGSSPSQQGRLFMKKNLTWINKKKTKQLVVWPYIDCK